MKAITIVLLFAVVSFVWSAADDADNEDEIAKRQGALAALDSAVAAGELAIKIQDRYIEAFNALHGAKDLGDRTRSLELIIANDSKYKLKFAGEYFDSGTWFSQPDAFIEPQDATVATVANRQGSWLTGVTGGMSWEIVGTGKYLTLGFTNPYMGSFKNWVGVIDRADPKYGYDHSQDESLKLFSMNGFALLAQVKSSEIAARRFTYAIKDE